MQRWLSLVLFLALVGLAALTGIQFRPGAWYEALAKPEWTPSNAVFPVAWGVLYVLIAIAGWRVWLAEGLGAALVVWALGLLLNSLWSYLMFGLHQIGWALADIYLLLAVILAFMVLAWRVDRLASVLFVPYACWVAFASLLNLAIWATNG